MLLNRLLAAGLFCLSTFALSWTARAGDYRYPAAGPVLALTLPDGWRVGPEKPAEAELTTFTTPQDANYVVVLMTMAPRITKETRNATLIQAAKNAASAAGLDGITISEVTEEKLAQGLRMFALVHATGTLKGTGYTFVYGAFPLTEGGHYYIIGELGPDASLLAHKEEFQKIANSIQPYQPAPPLPPGPQLAPTAPPLPPGQVATPHAVLAVMPRVLVVGCGFVGEAAADRFHAAGWEVRAWTHSEESAARLRALKPYPVAARDITDSALLRVIVPEEGSPDVLVACASSGRGGPDAYRRVYLEGARHLHETFPQARFVFTGSTSVYAQTDGGWVDEMSPAEPDRETGRILRATEDFVLATPGGTVARLAGIYGPGRSALLRKFLAGESVLEGDGGRWLNQIHRDDAANALCRLAQPGAPPGVYNAADDTPLTQLALHRALSERNGRPLPPFGPVDTNRKRGWTSKRVSNRRLRALGWQPGYPSFLDWADQEL